MQTWLSQDMVLALSTGDEGFQHLASELDGRAWAAGIDVPAPEALASDPERRWHLARRGHEVEALTGDLAAAAVAFALRVETGPWHERPHATSWRAPRRTLPLRLAKLVRHRVPIRRFAAARAAVAALPDDGMAHGDYHPGNLLLAGDRLVVVDWEFLAPAPAGVDVMRLWTTARTPAERTAVREAVLADADDARRHRLGVVGRWLALRALAEAANDGPSEDRDLALTIARRAVDEMDDLP